VSCRADEPTARVVLLAAGGAKRVAAHRSRSCWSGEATRGDGSATDAAEGSLGKLKRRPTSGEEATRGWSGGQQVER